MGRATQVYVHDIAVAVPAHSYTQEFALSHMQRMHGGDGRIRRLLARIYRNSGIATRHSVTGDVDRYAEPTTGERNVRYESEARKLSYEAASRLLERHRLLQERITHLITASCTGFSAPGFDFYLIRDLPLPQGVHRCHLGYMGCFAAFPALRLARSICSAEPDARVLVVNVELCSLHLQYRDQADVMVANAIFADGASAALVSATRTDSRTTPLELSHFRTHTIPDSESAMGWTIGDTGFNMTLSAEVPSLVQRSMKRVLNDSLQDLGLTQDDIAVWAIHPGGRAILDSVADVLEIDRSELQVSYDVLRDYGNMSSATIMFVLDRILSGPSDGGIFAAAFGPGLTIESAYLEKTG